PPSSPARGGSCPARRRNQTPRPSRRRRAMPNRVTKGKALVGSLRGRRGGMGQFAGVFSVTRAMTTATNAFALPQDAQVIGLSVVGAAVSNAGTTATLSVGKVGG